MKHCCQLEGKWIRSPSGLQPLPHPSVGPSITFSTLLRWLLPSKEEEGKPDLISVSTY